MARGSFHLIILVFLVELLTRCIPANCNQNPHLACTAKERKALIKFKESLYDRSGRLTSWHGDDCCRWNGVICDNSTGYVVEIDLRNSSPDIDGFQNEFFGEVSPSLLDLKYLTHLDLSGNNFSGAQIPDFIGSISKLRYLNLSCTYFGGPIPTNLGKLSELNYLDLSCYDRNNLIAKNGLNWTSGLSSLRYLNLGGVYLSQAASHWLQTLSSLRFLEELHLAGCWLENLPTSLPFVNFTSLSVLDLADNAFESRIPEWLFNLISGLKWLDLSGNGLYGMLPHTLSNSTLLEELDLSSNNIEGKLTRKLGNLCNLKILVLSGNNFDGGVTEFIDGLSECSNKKLETLDLKLNQLSGNLPNSIGSLKNLRYLHLSRNLFEGSIPDTIGNLSSLREFYLSNNQMSGKIPPGIGQLVSLEVVYLSGNNWGGVITEAHLANLSRLRELWIGTNFPNTSVVFNMSPDWTPSFKLEYLYIQGCKLGPKFPTWLKNQTELQIIVMTHTMISDVIPDWFLNMGLELAELYIAHNQFRGKVPNSLGFIMHSFVDLSSNSFDGPLLLWSPNVTFLCLRDNMLSGPIPSSIGIAMPSLERLDISRNNLNGTIPISVGNLTGLIHLGISGNRLTGNIPRFWENVPTLEILDMSNNSLSGSIPVSIGSISYLKFLILSSNNLSGELPSSLKNCSQLATLDIGDNQFSGEIPIWIGEYLPYLSILSLRNNLFTGNIPQEICRLSGLHVFDVSRNKLTGLVPRCIGNLSRFQMDFKNEPVNLKWSLKLTVKGNILWYTLEQLDLVKTLDLSSNDLFGEIPSEIGDIVRLEILNLSMNHFTGRIPPKFGNLKALETLDLSQNQLSGPIPTTLVSLTFLNHINFSYNNLSGMIPTGNQFQALPDPSIYVGNSALCGFPLTVECNKKSGSSFSGENKEDDDGDDRLEKVWFFSFVGLGFMTGFWAVLGTLFLKQDWRIAYFRFVERMAVYLQTKISRMGRR